MYVHHFAGLLAGWLNSSAHPGIAQVRTCADIGRHEQPVGVAVTLSDGWLWLLQTVGTAPDGGDANRSSRSPRPESFDGDWCDRPDYQQARKAFEAEQAAYDGPKTRIPQASRVALMDLAAKTVRRSTEPTIAAVEVDDDRAVLRVRFTDGSRIYGYPVGFVAPGETSAIDL